MDAQISDILGFNLFWLFYGGKIKGDIDQLTNRVKIGRSDLPLEDGLVVFCKICTKPQNYAKL